MIRSLARLVLFDAIRGLGNLRWLVVPPILFVIGWLDVDYVQYDYQAQEPREVNIWDGPLSMMTYGGAVIFILVLGFVIVSGDLYVRDRASGTAAMSLVRSRSRMGWWAAKIGALGLLAFVYSAVFAASTLAASATRLPLALGPSPAAQVPWSDQSALYPRFEELPMPLFFLLVVLYTALALWAVGAVVVWVSALYPRVVTPLAFGFLWVVGISWIVAPVYQRQGFGKLDPVYQVSYAVHFGAPGLEATPWSTSCAVILGTLALVLLAGAWKLRRTDI